MLKENRREITSIALILIGGILNGVIASASKPFQVGTDDYDIDKWNWWVHVGLNSVTGIFTLIYTIIVTEVIKNYVIPDEKIEPKCHEEPNSIIGLDKQGITLGINYNKDPAPAIPVAGREEWKDQLTNILDPEKGTMDSRMIMNNDGSVSINSNGDTKEIKFSVGKKTKPDSLILSNHDGVVIEAGSSQIHVKKDGIISIFAKGNINLVADDNIVLASKNKKALEIKTSEAKYQGALYTKQLRVDR